MNKLTRLHEAHSALLEDFLDALHGADRGATLPGHYGNGAIVIERLGTEQNPRRATSGRRAKR